MIRIPWYIGWPIVIALVYYLANRAVYQPFRYPQGEWGLQSTVHAEDAWIRTADGVRLHAWWVPRAGARFATLFLHGNGGNLTHRASHIRELAQAGSAVLMLDYRGYGRSAGHPTERGLYRDADAAYEHLARLGYTPERIVIHGESLGTAVAVDLASRRRCAAVVLEAPFTRMADLTARIVPVLGPLLVRGFDSRAKIGGVRVPLLFVQGDRDEVVPYRLGRALFEAANEPKAFWTVPGAGHNDIVETAGAAYRERMRTFYSSLSW